MQATEAIPLFRTRPSGAAAVAAKEAAIAAPHDPALLADYADMAEALPGNRETLLPVLSGKNDAAILEAAHFCCQSCGWSKWTYPVKIIPVSGGYNVLCEKCAARHG
jgi:hypothetical protein